MIKTGSYAYIRGTNIEVGVRHASKDPEQPFACCVFRFGVRYGHHRSTVPPYKVVIVQIPTVCLTRKCDFDLMRGKLKKKFKHSTLEQPMPDKEGLFNTMQDPDVYDIIPCGKKFFHLIKGPTPDHILKPKPYKLSIFGIEQLAFPFKSYDSATGICTFNTRPKRQAHISVLRRHYTMEKGSILWRKALTQPLDVGYIRGSNIRVLVLIPYDDISYYKIRTSNSEHTMALWLPNKEITTQFVEHEEPRNLQFIGNVYVNGLPHPFKAYSGNASCLFVRCDGDLRRVHPDHAFRQPKKEYDYLLDYKTSEAAAWQADQERRRKHITRFPIAVN